MSQYQLQGRGSVGRRVTPRLVLVLASLVVASGTVCANHFTDEHCTDCKMSESAYAAIGGGLKNDTLKAAYAVIGGGTLNQALAWGTTIAGGVRNEAGGSSATVGGGKENEASGWASTIAGGARNIASGSTTTIGGGKEHDATAWGATIAGGVRNEASGDTSTVGGGLENRVSESYAVIAGGKRNVASAGSSTVSGGAGNVASGVGAAVPGGAMNLASGEYSFAAGFGARATTEGSFVWHDATSETGTAFEPTAANQFLIRASGNVGINTNDPDYPLTVSGLIGSSKGFVLRTGSMQAVGDALALAADDVMLLDVGGTPALYVEWTGMEPNVIAGSVDSYSNYVRSGSYGCSILGGGGNEISGHYGTIVGAWGSQIGDEDEGPSASERSFIGGGSGNALLGLNSAILGGEWAGVWGNNCVVIGGRENGAAGDNSVCIGGWRNDVAGTCCLAAGTGACAEGAGAFCWADHTLRLNEITGQMEPVGIEAAQNAFLARATGGFTLVTGVDDVSGDPAISTWLRAGAADWSYGLPTENHADLDGQAVLTSLREMPVTQWNLVTQDASIHHVGPTTQAFFEAFGLGESSEYITGSDVSGVALAAVKELYEICLLADERIAALESQVVVGQEVLYDLLNRIAELEQRVDACCGGGD